ncbi:hypothetical protein NLG97_g11389 [Lecanicillium saksenae]|uniref:Uncharacterized protein n=1 Tax=Lecanicillium saksenae TaxID=468837 RepID=A0ACC1QB16_9HYPO|nr:hypothetical protein NLG97_g11389 [Lecanicillium saksenae]
MNPEQLQHMQQFMRSMTGGDAGAPAGPPDNRPPEERYEEQLRQLNDMGFFDFDRNVAALRRSGGREGSFDLPIQSVVAQVGGSAKARPKRERPAPLNAVNECVAESM